MKTENRIRVLHEALIIEDNTVFRSFAGLRGSRLRFATYAELNAGDDNARIGSTATSLDFYLPFGVEKKSSLGPREQAKYAVESQMIVKAAYTKV